MLKEKERLRKASGTVTKVADVIKDGTLGHAPIQRQNSAEKIPT